MHLQFLLFGHNFPKTVRQLFSCFFVCQSFFSLRFANVEFGFYRQVLLLAGPLLALIAYAHRQLSGNTPRSIKCACLSNISNCENCKNLVVRFRSSAIHNNTKQHRTTTHYGAQGGVVSAAVDAVSGAGSTPPSTQPPATSSSSSSSSSTSSSSTSHTTPINLRSRGVRIHSDAQKQVVTSLFVVALSCVVIRPSVCVLCDFLLLFFYIVDFSFRFVAHHRLSANNGRRTRRKYSRQQFQFELVVLSS
jgi:hypothetical protein